MQYDVIIIGAGPGGIFSAYELSKLCPEKRIAVFEEGQPLEKRRCPIDGKTVKHCIGCPTCAIMNGFGGAGAFSDGKYNLTNDFGGTTYFPAAGTYSEDALLEVIAHVEAASGGQAAKILGTKKALRKLSPSIQSDGYKDAMYNNGYAGKFFGSDVVVIPQRHKVGTTSFVMPDDTITVIAGSPRPIKCVYEGQSLMIQNQAIENADLTASFLYAEKYGCGILMTGGNEGIGKYKFA